MITNYKQYILLLEKINNNLKNKNIIDIISREELDILLSSDKKLGFHSGNLLMTSESGLELSSGLDKSGGRSTGHFGNGNYFFGDINQAISYKIDSKGTGRDTIMIVDFNHYHTLNINNKEIGLKLHKTFKELGNVNIFPVNENELTNTLKLIDTLKFEGFGLEEAFNKEEIIKKLDNYYNGSYNNHLKEDFNNFEEDNNYIDYAISNIINTLKSEDVFKFYNNNYSDYDFIDDNPEYENIENIEKLKKSIKVSMDFTKNDVENFIKEIGGLNKDLDSEDIEYVVCLDIITKLYTYLIDDLSNKYFNKLNDIDNTKSDNNIDEYLNILNNTGLGLTKDDLKTYHTKYINDLNNKDIENPSSISKIILKGQGYDGICVFGIEGLDNSQIGSILFELNTSNIWRVKKDII